MCPIPQFGMRALVASFLALLARPIPASADVISFGLQAPIASPRQCVEAWQYVDVARRAADYVTAQAWWQVLAPPLGPSLVLELLPSDDAYSAWVSAQAYAVDPPPPCVHTDVVSCRVFRAAIIGPQGTASAQLTGLAARASQMPWLMYGAPGAGLTPSPYRHLPPATETSPVLRLCPTTGQAAAATYAALQRIGWRRASVVFSADDADSVAAAEALVAAALADGG